VEADRPQPPYLIYTNERSKWAKGSIVIHVDTYRRNVLEIERLLKIHDVVSEIKGPGFRAHARVLTKSCVVLLLACWESFVEDLASTSFEFILSNASDHNAFPLKVLTLTSKDFWNSKDERGVWALAGDGWKTELMRHKNLILSEHIGSFNTPRADRVDALFQSMVGLNKLSSKWHWQGMTAKQARENLGRLISLRGEIAHRVATSRSVTQQDVRNYASFVGRLCVISSNSVREFVHARVGKFPWNEVILTTD